MDSLLASYGSSDDDDDNNGGERDPEEEPSAASSPQLPPPKPSSIFGSSLPPPKSSSIFGSSLPPPKLSSSSSSSSSSSFFSSLPRPQSLLSNPTPAAPDASRSASDHLGELDGEEKGGNFKPQTLLFSSLPRPKPSSEAGNLGEEDGEEEEEEEEKGGVFTAGASSSTPYGVKHSLFSALPPPGGSSSSSLLSHVPPPMSEPSNSRKTTGSASPDRNPKRIVQFKLPLNPSVLKGRDLDDDDEEDEREKERKRNKGSSTAPKGSSSVSSMFPAPKNTFGSLSSAASASSRRSMLDADVPAANSRVFASVQGDSALEDSRGYGNHGNGLVGVPDEAGIDEAKDVGFSGITTNVNWDPSAVEGTAYSGYEAYSGYDDGSAASYWDPGYEGAANYGNYDANWSDGTAAVASEIPDIGRVAGKRSRSDIPAEIMEVKQDELMKNRPRPDQSKLTGIAFGPSHQPAPSAKGKPSKLHKRKHQIGSLYFDMRQKEMELAERRARGLLTKSETQAKYGW